MNASVCYCLICGVWIMGVPRIVPPQTTPASFANLLQILKANEKVVVTEQDGRVTTGILEKLTVAELTVLTPERRLIAEPSVKQIRRIDSVWNGALIGASVGGAVYLGGQAFCGINQLNCNAARGAEVWIPGSPLTAVLGPLIGAVVGALVDRAKGNEVVYSRSQPSSR